uniref:Uncharacterized protein n=1 Tax=Physcomitrium patens TaxID=3218 RepID=A0A2K1KM54_PHYPA|nr:hypothetical protein PHYPA_005742 [Physcomitrium patens]
MQTLRLHTHVLQKMHILQSPCMGLSSLGCPVRGTPHDADERRWKQTTMTSFSFRCSYNQRWRKWCRRRDQAGSADSTAGGTRCGETVS